MEKYDISSFEKGLAALNVELSESQIRFCGIMSCLWSGTR